MRILKHTPKNQARVISIRPQYLLLKDACLYTGMKEDLFRRVSREKGLSVYAYGTKKLWYKITELNELMESFLIIKKQCSSTAN